MRLERQKDVLALQGTVTWEGDLDAMRTARVFAEEQTDYDADSG